VDGERRGRAARRAGRGVAPRLTLSTSCCMYPGHSPVPAKDLARQIRFAAGAGSGLRGGEPSQGTGSRGRPSLVRAGRGASATARRIRGIAAGPPQESDARFHLSSWGGGSWVSEAELEQPLRGSARRAPPRRRKTQLAEA